MNDRNHIVQVRVTGGQWIDTGYLNHVAALGNGHRAGNVRVLKTR
jgi:hypothetical protein